MLSILLTILKIVGIVLLSILCLILLLIITVLFVPLRYKANGSYEPLVLSAKASFLFHIFSAKIEYNNELRFKVSILGIPIFSNKKKSKTSIKEKRRRHSKSNAATDSESVAEDNKVNDNILKSVNNETSNNANNEESFTNNLNTGDDGKKGLDSEPDMSSTDSADDKANQTDGTEKKKLTDSIREIKDNIDYYKELFEKPSTKAAINQCKDCIGKVLRSILPRRGRINLEIGLENAGLTGKIMAAYYALWGYIGKVVKITPYYDKVIIKGDLYLKGHIRVVNILYQAIRLYFDKNCHRLIKILIKRSKTGKDK